jgi:hypothetical protein
MIIDIYAHILTKACLSKLADEGTFRIELGENGA